MDKLSMRFIVISVSIFLNVVMADNAVAAVDTRKPASFEADSVAYDYQAQTITATGDVIVEHDNRTLFADSITYQQTDKTIIARGNVKLLTAEDITIQAAEVDVTDDLKTGTIAALEMFLADASRLKASSGTRDNAVRSILNHAAYTPCELCTGHAPLWEIRAREVVYDEQRHTIVYRGATVEVMGLPVFYLPYLSHPDHTVKRQAGLLPPRFSNSKDRGFTIQAPVYIPFSAQRDVTLTPIVMSSAGYIGLVDYREHLGFGTMDVRFSGGRVDRSNSNDVAQGHIDAEGRFDFTRTWRGGFDIERSSSRDYLRRYDLDNRDTLTTQSYAERLEGQQYFRARTMTFQGLRDIDDDDTAPVLLPEFDYNWLSQQSYGGGRFAIDANALSLQRREGRDVQRLAIRSGWQRQATTPYGGRLHLDAGIHTDAYSTRNNPLLTPQDTPDATATRIFPQASLQYRHPFVRSGSTGQQLIEPLAGVVLAPNSGNDRDIPNEDSEVLRFDDANIFLPNRFSGVDRISPGSRIDYGLNSGWYDAYGMDIEVFLGQSYRLTNTSIYTPESGLSEARSDYVGSTRLSFSPLVEALHSYRIGKKDGTLQRNEVALIVETAPVQLNLDYLYLSEEASTLFGKREEITAQASTLLTDQWVLSGNIIRDINDKSTRYAGIGLAYYVKCLSLGIDFARDFANDSDERQENVVMLRVSFDHVGMVDFREYLRRQNRITGKERVAFD